MSESTQSDRLLSECDPSAAESGFNFHKNHQTKTRTIRSHRASSQPGYSPTLKTKHLVQTRDLQQGKRQKYKRYKHLKQINTETV